MATPARKQQQIAPVQAAPIQAAPAQVAAAPSPLAKVARAQAQSAHPVTHQATRQAAPQAGATATSQGAPQTTRTQSQVTAGAPKVGHAAPQSGVKPTSSATAKRPLEAIAGTASKPVTPVDGLKQRLAGLEVLAASDARLCSAENETGLEHLAVNELRQILGARQVYLFRAKSPGRFRVATVSSVAVVDRDTPFVRWIEAIADRVAADRGNSVEPTGFEIAAYAPENSEETKTYPFQNCLWQPIQNRNGETFAVLIAARERGWTEAELTLSRRQANLISAVWAGFGGSAIRLQRKMRPWLMRVGVAALLLAAAVIPVPLTTLAPVEIIAAEPQRVTAPLDGVISEILVAPNQPVKAGQAIIQYDSTELTNHLRIAEQQLEVAASRYDRARQAAFSDEDARHELAIALSEWRLKRAERDFAKAQLAKTVVLADRDGIAIYPDKDRLLGRPVSTGEQLMDIANPERVAARIEVPVADAIILDGAPQARLFLDSDPLRTVSAAIESVSYHAEPNATQSLVYRVKGKLDQRPEKSRIGTRGTAQLSGQDVPLIFFLLRRPISATRQFLGI